MVKLEIIKIKKPAEVNFILAHSHFIKTVTDVYETLFEAMPGIEFGLAFCEASGKRLIRADGTNKAMIDLAIENAKAIGAGHSLLVFLKNAYPVNVLNRLKNVSEITRIFCATANPVEVIVGETKQGRAILGVVDGEPPLGVEKDEDKKERQELLRKIGYKK